MRKKRCTCCQAKKALRAFYACARGRLGRQSYCKVCMKVKTTARNMADPDAQRNRSWKHRGINMTTERYAVVLSEQGGRCAICQAPQVEIAKRFAVDHDHATGKVRGLLCDKCNKALGLFGDTAKGLQRALDYLT